MNTWRFSRFFAPQQQFLPKTIDFSKDWRFFGRSEISTSASTQRETRQKQDHLLERDHRVETVKNETILTAGTLLRAAE